MARRNTKKNSSGNQHYSKKDSSQSQTSTDSKEGTKDEQVDASKEPNAGSDKKSTHNDPSWYSQFPELVRDSCSIPFSKLFGAPVEFIDDQLGTTLTPDVAISSLNKFGVAGLCALHVLPTIGQSFTMNDATTIAANNLYSYIRVSASGKKNYDPVDVFIYCNTIVDMYSFIYFCKRLYNFAFMYSQRNAYFYRALIEACGVAPGDVDWLLANLANFRMWLNTLIHKVSSWAVPNLPIFARRAFLYTGIYIENPYENIKDQLYMYVPDGFMMFSLDSTGKGSCTLEFLGGDSSTTTNIGSTYTIGQLMNYGTEMVARVYGDEDFALMSGDIIRAFGSNIIGLTTLDEIGGILPTYDYYVLNQMKNATITNRSLFVRNSSDPTYWTNKDGEKRYNGCIYQSNDGVIESAIKIPYSWWTDKFQQARLAVTLKSDKIISVENNMPTPEDVIEATRMTVCEDSNYLITGSEVVTDVTVFRYIDGDSPNTMILSKTNVLAGSIRDTQITSQFVTSGYNEFKYAPHMLAFTGAQASDSSPVLIGSIRVLSNLENYTLINKDDLKRMHEAALMSLFYVPGVALIR